MRASLGLMVLFVVGGCGAQAGRQANDAWVPASATLQTHGIYSLSTSNEASAQVVQLRDGNDAAVGSLTVTAGASAHSAALVFGSNSWSQSFTVGEQATMVITLDGAQATFSFSGGAWVGDGAAQELMTRSKPYIELAGLVASEAHLTVSTPSTTTQQPSAGGAPESTPAPTAPPPAPKLTCTDIVVAATGAAFFFEPADMACKRAVDQISAQCHTATVSLAVPQGLDCCNVAEPPCFNKLNAGLYTFASTSGYLSQIAQ